MKTIRIVSILFALVAGTGVALAAPGGADTSDRGPRGDRGARHAKMLEKLDLNKDGVVDHAERAQFRQQRADALFDRLDTNKDGVITRAELRAGHPMRGHGKGMKAGPDGKGKGKGWKGKGDKGAIKGKAGKGKPAVKTA